MKLVADSNLAATGVSYGSTPLLNSTELADIYQKVSGSSVLSMDTHDHNKEAKRKVASTPDATLEPPPHENESQAAGKDLRVKKTRQKLTAPKTSQLLGLRLPEFVDLLQVRRTTWSPATLSPCAQSVTICLPLSERARCNSLANITANRSKSSPLFVLNHSIEDGRLDDSPSRGLVLLLPASHLQT